MPDQVTETEGQHNSAQTDGSSKPRDFFAVDRRAWAGACALGMNAAVAYLVLARGTARDNRTTSWSVHSIEKYTSISRGRAQAAVELLTKQGLVEVLRGSTMPKYYLRPAHEVPGCEGYPPPAMDEMEERLFNLLKSGERKLENKARKELKYRNPRTIAKGLVEKGWAKERDCHHFEPITYDKEAIAQPDWIWLPNELVSGAAGEVAPVELVRQIQDPMALRLLIDLYHVQNLRDDGGISRTIIYQEYERFEVGRQAQFVIWGFCYKQDWVTWRGPMKCHYRQPTSQELVDRQNVSKDYFEREGHLVDLGLIEWIPTLIESSTEESEIIHPYGMEETDGLEDRLGSAAHHAAWLMLTKRQQEWADEKKLRLAPVPRHFANVQMTGIARLRYRPKTRMTAAWWADLQTKGKVYLKNYEELSAAREHAASVSA